jgi:flagellar protein FlaG
MIEKVTAGGFIPQSFNSSFDKKEDTGIVRQIKALEGIDKEQLQSDPVIKEKIQNVVKGMNEFLSGSNTHLKFELHDKLQEYYVKIVDNQTQEIIKEIPAKKILDMHAAMTEFVGLMLDKKV